MSGTTCENNLGTSEGDQTFNSIKNVSGFFFKSHCNPKKYKTQKYSLFNVAQLILHADGVHAITKVSKFLTFEV